MSQPTANVAPKVHFLVRHKLKNKPDQTYDIQPKMGDEGRTLVIGAESAVRGVGLSPVGAGLPANVRLR